MADDLYVLGLGIDSGALALSGRNVESTLTRIETKAQVAKVRLLDAFGNPVAAAASSVSLPLGRIPPVLDEVASTSTRTERAASRLSFGLSRIATTGTQGGLGLRSVETGLMTLVPGLGWGLVAVTALVEGVELLTKHTEAQDAAWQKLTASLRVDAPISMQRTKIEQTADAMATLNARIAEADRLAAAPGLVRSIGSMFFGLDPTKLREQMDELEDILRIGDIHTRHGARDEATTKSSDALKEETRSLTDQIAKLGMTNGEWAAYQAAMKGVGAEGQRTARTLRETADALESLHKSAAEKAAEATRKIVEGQRQAAEDATEKNRKLTREAIERYDEQTAAFKASLEARKRLAEEHEKAMEGLVRRGLDAVLHGDVSALLGLGSELAAPAILAALEGGSAAGAGKKFAGPTGARALLAGLDFGALTGASGGGRGHTFQTQVNVNATAPDSRGMDDVLERHAPTIAQRVAQEFLRHPELFGGGTQ